ncbi:MAG: hypothetical protein ABII97_02350 [Patescibacteria group bacterium]
MNDAVLLIFNGIGIIISMAAIAVIAHKAVKMTGLARKGVISFLKGFLVVGLSFVWTFFFGQLVVPSDLLTVQSVLLSFGMALLIYSANKLFDISQRAKI